MLSELEPVSGTLVVVARRVADRLGAKCNALSGRIMILAGGKRSGTNPVPTGNYQQTEDRIAQDKYPGRSVVVQERF